MQQARGPVERASGASVRGAATPVRSGRDRDAKVRLGGFEPPTGGLEGRCSSTELQAPVGKGSAGPGADWLARAEVDGQQDDAAPAEDAGGTDGAHGGDPDFAKCMAEEVLAVARAREPGGNGRACTQALL